MTNRLLRLFLNILEIFMQCLCFVSISIIFAYGPMGYDAMKFERCLMICIPVIAAYIFRKLIDNFGAFMILHIIFVALSIYVAQNRVEMFIFILITSALVFYSFSLKMNSFKSDEEKVPFVIGLGITVISYALGIYAGNNQILMQSGMVIMVLFIAAQLVYNNMNELSRVLTDNKETENFPASQVIGVNLFMTIAALVAVLIGMLAFYSGPYGSFFHMIGEFFRKLIVLFLKLILYRKAPKKEMEMPTEIESESQSGESYAAMSPDSFSDLINSIIMIFGIVFLIILAISFISGILRFIRSYKKKRKIGSDIVEYIKPDRKKRQYIKVLNENRKEDPEADSNLKVRKIYKKHVMKGIGREKVPENILPAELTRMTITQEPQEAKIITDIYEKARYSDKIVGPDEIEKVKNASINDKRNPKSK